MRTAMLPGATRMVSDCVGGLHTGHRSSISSSSCVNATTISVKG